MRLLIISSTYYPDVLGGAELSVRALAERLSETGIDVHVLTFGLEDKKEVINQVNITRRYIPERSEAILRKRKISLKDKIIYRNLPFWDLHMYHFYLREIKRLAPDVVHIANPMHYCATPMCCRAAARLGLPVLVSVRDFGYAPNNSHHSLKNSVLQILYKRAFLKYGATLHFISNFMSGAFDRHGYNGIPKKTIYNAVEIGRLPKRPFDEKKAQIVYAGRLEKKKGLDDLFTLPSRFEGDFKSRVDFLYVGDGSIRKALPAHTRCTGWVSYMESVGHISESRVLVLPAVAEPFGRVLLEALACGTLCVARNAGACPEVLGANPNYLYSDSEDLFLKVKRILLLTKAEYERELESARNVLERFSIENQISEFVALYRELRTK